MSKVALDGNASQPSTAPRAWVAALFSVLTTGLGHVYAGAPWRGLGAFAIAVMAGFVGLWFALLMPGRLELAVLVLVVLGIAVAGHVGPARRAAGTVLPPGR